MIRNLLESIKGIDIFPVIGMIIFFLFFIIILVRIIKMDEKYINEMKKLPLEPDNNEIINLTGEKNGK